MISTFGVRMLKIGNKWVVLSGGSGGPIRVSNVGKTHTIITARSAPVADQVETITADLITSFSRFPADIESEAEVKLAWSIRDGPPLAVLHLTVVFGLVTVFDDDVVLNSIGRYNDGLVDWTPVDAGEITCTATLYSGSSVLDTGTRTFS